MFASRWMTFVAALWAAQTWSAACAGQPAAVSAASATDVFVGRGVAGPYLLTWRNIEAGSETVLRNGARVTRGVDYDLNETAGVLSFRSALTARDIARVDYLYLPGKAAVNSSIVAIPFGFRLLDDPRGALSMNAVFRPDLAGKPGSSTPALSAVQLGFEGTYRAGTTSEFGGKLALDTRFGNLTERTGLLLSEKSAFRGGKFDVTLSMAGAEFGLADQTGIAAGKQSLQANLELTSVRSLKATLGYGQTTDLTPAGNGSTVTTVAEKLVGALDKDTRLQAVHTTTQAETPGSGATSRETARLQVDRRLDRRTDLTALLDWSEASGPGGPSVTQSTALDLRARPTTWLSVAGTYRNRLSPGGAEDYGRLQLAAQPSRRMKIDATLADRLGVGGGLHTREATVEYIPAGNLSLSGGIALRSEADQEFAAHSLGATWRPGLFEFGAGMRFREASAAGQPRSDALDSYDLRVAVRLRRAPLRLTGTWAENPEDGQGTVQRLVREGMGLKTTLGRVDLMGDYLREYDPLGARIGETLSWQLAYSLRKGTRLTGEVRDTRSRDATAASTDTYTLALTHQVGSAIDLTLSAGLTQRMADGVMQPDSEYRAETKLRLRF